jgi:2-polyprenyl-6-methoxyphenol hydroxylase-like FAD-dependent oxidoreductase
MGSRQLRNAGKRRALVVGGSMSGLLAALLLRRAGWDVNVFERVESELAGRGAGIVAQPDLIATLSRLGIDPADLGVEITRRQILDSSGRLTGEFACPQVLTAWERVYRALRDAFPPERYHRRRGVRSFAQTERSVNRPLRRWRHRRGRTAGRRGRPALHHSPAMSARPCPALCRLCGLARADSGGGVSTGDSSRAVQLA